MRHWKVFLMSLENTATTHNSSPKTALKIIAIRKKNHIGLYLINPNIDWLELQNELDASYAFSITDITFNSVNCKTLYVLTLAENHKATIRHLPSQFESEKEPKSNSEVIPGTGEKLTVQWQQNEDVVTLVHKQKEYRFVLEREYLRHGNRRDLLLTLSTGNKEALGLTEPFACKFESRTPLVD